MTTLFQDLRYTLRQLAKSPGFAAVAVITLALGIGANTTIFSVVNTVLLRPLPYNQPDSLARIWGNNPKKGVDVDLLSPADFQDLRAQGRSFEDLGFSTDQVFNLTNAGDPESIPGYQLSANFFQILGTNSALGRTFSPGEDTAGHDHVVVLSHRLWQRRFGGDRNVIGTVVTLNGQPYTVIGVMPPEFYYPVHDNELWTPFVIPADAFANHGARFLRVLARLKPGVSLQQAQVEVSTIVARIAAQHPDTNADQGASIVSIKVENTRDIRPALLTLMGAVGFVLLIACANVANLLLARATKRRGELAVRSALGASHLRLLRQFLTESLFLSLVGGALGIALTATSANLLVSMFPRTISNLNIPRVENIPIDAKILGFAFLVSVVTGVLFGLAPALRSDLNLSDSLKEMSKGLTRGSQRNIYRHALVVSEIALSLILLVGAGLLGRSFLHLLGRNLGFTPDHLLTFRIILPETKYASPTQQHQFIDQVISNVRALPRVHSVGTATFLPLSGWHAMRTFRIAGRAGDSSTQGPPVVWSEASVDYFRTMEITTIQGRSFTDQDTAKSLPVAVISNSTARKYWPNESAIGARITLKYESTPREVVGIVADVRHFGAESQPSSEIYVPYQQGGAPIVCFAVRTSSSPLDLAGAMQRKVWSVDKDQPVSYLMSMDQLVAESLAPQRVLMFLLAVFATLALGLASVGVYSVMAYMVVERTHEIGLRMALGAARSDVLRLVLRRGMSLALIGFAFGLAGALTMSRFLSSLLYGVSPVDLRTYTAVSAVLAGVVFLACCLPARRAAKVDPMVALRYE